MISWAFICATVCNLLINSYCLIQTSFNDNPRAQPHQFVIIITGFLAGFNFHFACLMRRNWLTVTTFGLIRAWFLIGYAIPNECFSLNILLAIISITTDVICVYLRLNQVKPANIKPPGC